MSNQITGNAGTATAGVAYAPDVLGLEDGSGSILLEDGTEISLEGPSGTATADGSGNYTVSSLTNSVYILTPGKTGYTFTPTSRSETIAGADLTGVNFTATAASSGGGSFMQAFRNFANKKGGL